MSDNPGQDILNKTFFSLPELGSEATFGIRVIDELHNIGNALLSSDEGQRLALMERYIAKSREAELAAAGEPLPAGITEQQARIIYAGMLPYSAVGAGTGYDIINWDEPYYPGDGADPLVTCAAFAENYRATGEMWTVEPNGYYFRVLPRGASIAPTAPEDAYTQAGLELLNSTTNEEAAHSGVDMVLPVLKTAAVSLLPPSAQQVLSVTNRVRQFGVASEVSRPLFASIGQYVGRGLYASTHSVFISSLGVAVAAIVVKRWVLKPVLKAFRSGVGLPNGFEIAERISHIASPDGGWTGRGIDQDSLLVIGEKMEREYTARQLAEQYRIENDYAEAVRLKNEAAAVEASRQALALATGMASRNYIIGRDGKVFIPVESLTPELQAELANVTIITT